MKKSIFVPDAELAKYAGIPTIKEGSVEYGLLEYDDLEELTEIQKELAKNSLRMK